MTIISRLRRCACTALACMPAIAASQPAATMTLQRFEQREESRLMAADGDGDGRISRAEYIGQARSGKTDPAARFAKIDRNGDGMLDGGEIDAMLTRRFTRLDTNGDGVLTAQERMAARKNVSPAATDGE